MPRPAFRRDGGGGGMTGGPAARAADGRALRLRIVSALVLGTAAVAAALGGGLGFAMFWCAASIAVAAEWIGLFAARRRRIAVGVAALGLAVAAALLVADLLAASLLAAACAAALVALLCRPMAGLGVLYALPAMLAPVLLRADPAFGLAAVAWLFGVVWGTDIAAFFVGRAVGGPKLWPAISPGKTWSGAVGGAACAIAASLAAGAAFGLTDHVALACIGLAGSAATQLGDLFQSGMKRRAGVKDSGHIIPGHGGVMDRLDGFIAAAALAAAVGTLHAGSDSAARGLLLW